MGLLTELINKLSLVRTTAIST